jgi:hypothetical protein
MKINELLVSSLPQEIEQLQMNRSQEQRVQLSISSIITVGSSKGPQVSDRLKTLFRKTALLFLGMPAAIEWLFIEYLPQSSVLIELALLHSQTSKSHSNGKILTSVC